MMVKASRSAEMTVPPYTGLPKECGSGRARLVSLRRTQCLVFTSTDSRAADSAAGFLCETGEPLREA